MVSKIVPFVYVSGEDNWTTGEAGLLPALVKEYSDNQCYDEMYLPVKTIGHDFLDHNWRALYNGEDPILNEIFAVGAAMYRHNYQPNDFGIYHSFEDVVISEFASLFEDCVVSNPLDNLRSRRMGYLEVDHCEEIVTIINQCIEKYFKYSKKELEECDEYSDPLSGYYLATANDREKRALASYFVKGWNYMDKLFDGDPYACATACKRLDHLGKKILFNAECHWSIPTGHIIRVKFDLDTLKASYTTTVTMSDWETGDEYEQRISYSQ